MAQTWTTDCFAGTHTAQTDLQNMEYNFATLKSLFSGSSAPANTVAGMPWFDTAKYVLKYRNSGDSAWIGVMHGDTSQKVWVYRDSAMDGWAVDSAVTDKVLAVKGGTTYTTGAASAGTWTISGISPTSDESGHTHTLADGGALSSVQVSARIVRDGAGSLYTAIAGGDSLYGIGTITGNGTGHTHNVTHTPGWRPSAAVGTLQRLDL